jgi:hypothetical protein
MSKTDRSSERAFICPMCGAPIDLDTDETADEGGKVMHAECYRRRVAGHGNDPPDPHHAE